MDTTQNIYFGIDHKSKYQVTYPTAELNELLVGKSIVSVDQDAATLTLSDGTVLSIVPNLGEGYDGGDFFLDRITAVENAITAVEAVTAYDGSIQDRADIYRINVYTAGIPALQELISVSGDIGNGYYGSGFSILVSR